VLNLNARILLPFQNYSREKSILKYFLVSIFAKGKQALLLVLVHNSHNQFLQVIWEIIQSDVKHILVLHVADLHFDIDKFFTKSHLESLNSHVLRLNFLNFFELSLVAIYYIPKL